MQIQNPCRYPEGAARKLRPWLEPLVDALAPTADSLTLRLVSDREMRRLNGTYRGKDRPTDVLTFPGDLADSDSGSDDKGDALFPLPPDLPTEALGGRHLGDVVVAVPTARRQAAEHGHTTETEVRVLVLHGLLHCLGYDHETDDGEMEAVESEWRQRFVPDAAVESETR